MNIHGDLQGVFHNFYKGSWANYWLLDLETFNMMIIRVEHNEPQWQSHFYALDNPMRPYAIYSERIQHQPFVWNISNEDNHTRKKHQKEAPNTYIFGRRGVGRGAGRSTEIASFANRFSCDRFGRHKVHLRRSFEPQAKSTATFPASDLDPNLSNYRTSSASAYCWKQLIIKEYPTLCRPTKDRYLEAFSLKRPQDAKQNQNDTVNNGLF